MQYRVPAITLVWEDNAYGLIAWKQAAAHGRTSHTDLRNPDLVAH